MTDVVASYLELFLAFSGVVAALAAFVRWGQKSLEKKIMDQIDQSTAQIKKDANGGQSLNDLHIKVDCLVERQAEIVEDVRILRSAVLTLENEKEGIHG